MEKGCLPVDEIYLERQPFCVLFYLSFVSFPTIVMKNITKEPENLKIHEFSGFSDEKHH
jgi:hypothetical protein